MRKLVGGLFIASLLGGVAYAEQLKKEERKGGVKVVATSQAKDRSGGEYIQVVIDSSNRKDAKIVKGRAWFIKDGQELNTCEFDVLVPALGREQLTLHDCTAIHPEGMQLVVDSVEAAPPVEPPPDEPAPDQPGEPGPGDAP